LSSFEVLTLAMRNIVTKQPVSCMASAQQEEMQPKKRNAARSSVPDNVSKLEHGEDVSQEKQSYHSMLLLRGYEIYVCPISINDWKDILTFM